MDEPQPSLVPAIGLSRATAMVVGTIIGASIFVQPSLVSGAVPTVVGILLVWLCSGALTLIGALVAAELSSAYPQTGGVYVYLREAYSPALAYLWGWAMFWVMHSGIIAAIAMVFARYLAHFIPLDDAGVRVAAVGSIAALSAVNYFGVRQASALQTLFTVFKVVAVLAIVALGARYLLTHDVPVNGGGAPMRASGFVSAMIAGLFTYGGWHMVTYAADETRRAIRTIPRALLIGTVIVTVAYIAINASYVLVLPIDTVASSSRVAADFADATLGSGGAGVLSALVVLSSLGGMTGIILAGPRVYLAMANDGVLFRWAAALHPRYRTPYLAIVAQGVWASVLVLTGSYRTLFTRVVYTEWIFFALMAASLFVLRRRPAYQPAFRLPAFAALTTIFVIASLTIVIRQMATEPVEAATGLAFVLAGLPVYWIWNSFTNRHANTLPS